MKKGGNKKLKRNLKVKDKKSAPASTKNAAVAASDVPLVEDPRFASQHWDPRFGRVPARASNASATLDERFDGALSRPGFQSSAAPVDRFGREKVRGRVAAQDIDSSSDEEEPKPFGPHSDSESESDISDSEVEDRPADEVANSQLSAIPRGNSTNRLAVIGLDWSSTRAVDIFASLSSFCPPGGALKEVAVHPSKLGLRRIAAEARLGPAVVSKVDQEMLLDARKRGVAEEDAKDSGEESSAESDGDAPGTPLDRERSKWKAQRALRKYEMERLQYFYAVALFDSRASADAVYEQCDGVEYAQSRRSFDLRFIPEDMKIETAPRETCSAIPDGYHPPNVAPSTLSNSTVKLSWDADAPERIVLKKRSMGRHEIDEDNLKAYLASASEDDAEDEEAIARKRRMLLGDDGDNADIGDKKEDAQMELEVKFEPGMLEKGEEIVKQREERIVRDNETPWESRLRRMSEKKAEKRRRHKEKLQQEDVDATVQNAGDSNEAASFDNDPFFSSEGGAASFKQAQRAAKKRRRAANTDEDAEDAAAKKRKADELELLLADDAVGADKDSLRDTLAQAESDDDEDRKQRRKEKRTRGRRRSEKERRLEAKIAKPSAFDTKDERFQGVFESHLFAMDPTHSKYKKNQTTERILKEKEKRFKRGGQAPSETGGQGRGKGEEPAVRVKGANVLQLAERIKAKAKSLQEK